MPIQKLTIEGSISLGDWTWESGQTAFILDENNNYLIEDSGDTAKVDFDATNVHVGDAAQTQLTQDLCKSAYDAESKIVDWIFEKGELDFLPKDVVNEFIKNRFNIS